MSHPTPDRDSPVEERLSQLLKLKRLERPDVAFWTEFDRGFRNRQLTTLVATQPWHARWSRRCRAALRRVAPPVAAIGAVAVGALVLSELGYFAGSSPAGSVSEHADHPTATSPEMQPLFIVDATNEQLSSEGGASASVGGRAPRIPATYPVRVIAKPSSTLSYELRSEPLSLRRAAEGPGKAARQSHGALIITADRPD